MESISSQQAGAVWQRVRGNSAPGQRLDLRALELKVLENLGAYNRSLASLSGGPRRCLAALAEDTRREAAILRGLQRLSDQQATPAKTFPSPGGCPSELLTGCYHRTSQLLTEYTARTVEPELGCVFQQLSQMAQAHCGQIAQILGSL